LILEDSTLYSLGFHNILIEEKRSLKLKMESGIPISTATRIINEGHALNMPVNNFAFIFQTTNSTR
jgi:hypothetical protein